MRLSDLLRDFPIVSLRADPTTQVRTVTRDSREAGPGVVFVAIRGQHRDGHGDVPAMTAGVVVVEREVVAAPSVGVVRVADTRAALPLLAAAIHHWPAKAVQVVGVTGTNGKTTVCTLVEGALRHLGMPVGRVGTTGAYLNGVYHKTSLTTPESTETQALLATMRGAGIATCLMEVSSIGVVQHRVQGIPYHLGVFTNLTRDHLDFHGTMAAYAAAKATLFQQLLRPVGGAPRALVCMDDPNWRLMHPPSDRWSYGFATQADVRIVRANTTPLGTDIDLETPLGGVSIRSPLVGRVNALNCAAALGIGLLLGIELNAMAKGLALVARVPGRLEPIANTRGLTVLVDYAHTPDALGACLDAVRAVTKGALWVVFGCGGNRDAGKRPEMGAMAEQKADYVVITSDNPRTEDPMSIIEQVVAGCSRVPTQVQPDRALAIAYALSQAKPGDSVVIAGKGHETYQEIGTTRHLFDDRQVVRHLLEAL